MELSGHLKTFISLLVVVNPVGAVPVFLTLTRGNADSERRGVARRAAIAMACVLLVSGFAGKWLLTLFGISLPSFRVAGGVLFFLMALDMLNARPSRTRGIPEEGKEAADRIDVAIVPMAIPQLAGPGAIGTTILYMDAAPLWPTAANLGLIVAAVTLAAWLAMRLAHPIGRALGGAGIQILTRVMGLLLVAVSIEFMVGGLRQLWGSR